MTQGVRKGGIKGSKIKGEIEKKEWAMTKLEILEVSSSSSFLSPQPPDHLHYFFPTSMLRFQVRQEETRD